MTSLRRLVLAAATLASVACDVPSQEPAERGSPVADASLFAYDRSVPLALTEEPVAPLRAGISVSRVSFASPGGDRVTGFLAVPQQPGPHAGIVMMHGLPGHADGAMRYQGLDFAERGAVVITIDAPWVRRNGLPDLTERDSVEQVQLMQDLSRAVDVLLARANVDPARIGYVGGSYGGAMGSLFVGIERRLAAAALFVADGGLVAHFTDEDGTVRGPLADVSARAATRWLAAMRPIEPIHFVGRAAPTALYFQNGRTDELVTAEDARALHAAASEPKTVQWYDGGHSLTPAARVDRLNWIVAQLRMRP